MDKKWQTIKWNGNVLRECVPFYWTLPFYWRLEIEYCGCRNKMMDAECNYLNNGLTLENSDGRGDLRKLIALDCPETFLHYARKLNQSEMGALASMLATGVHVQRIRIDALSDRLDKLGSGNGGSARGNATDNKAALVQQLEKTHGVFAQLVAKQTALQQAGVWPQHRTFEAPREQISASTSHLHAARPSSERGGSSDRSAWQSVHARFASHRYGSLGQLQAQTAAVPPRLSYQYGRKSPLRGHENQRPLSACSLELAPVAAPRRFVGATNQNKCNHERPPEHSEELSQSVNSFISPAAPQRSIYVPRWQPTTQSHHGQSQVHRRSVAVTSAPVLLQLQTSRRARDRNALLDRSERILNDVRKRSTSPARAYTNDTYRGGQDAHKTSFTGTSAADTSAASLWEQRVPAWRHSTPERLCTSGSEPLESSMEFGDANGRRGRTTVFTNSFTSTSNANSSVIAARPAENDGAVASIHTKLQNDLSKVHIRSDAPLAMTNDCGISCSIPNEPSAQRGNTGGTSNVTAHSEIKSSICWDPTPLIERLYKVDYVSKVERKKHKFINMEGHIEHLPLGVKSAYVQSQWKQHYFKTKEGRLCWYQTAYVDDAHALGDVLLAGGDVASNRDDSTFTLSGNTHNDFLVLRVPSNLYDKWQRALSSHCASSIVDSYIQPVYPPIQALDKNIIIIEIGSASIRAGVLTEEPSLPQLFFPNMAATFLHRDPVIGCDCLSPQLGECQLEKITNDNKLSPGATSAPNRQLISALVKHVFTQLQLEPSACRVLLSVEQCAHRQQLEDLLHAVLSSSSALGCAVVRQPCLVLYAYDVSTGVVVDVGERCDIVPVVDGYVVDSGIVSLPLGGTHIAQGLKSLSFATQCLSALLSAQWSQGTYGFVSPAERFILRYLVEQAAAVEHETSQTNELNEQRISLDKFNPTDSMIAEYEVGSERLACTEGLFNPKQWGLEMAPVHKLVFNAIQNAPMDARRNLYKNIYLAGGVTLLPGFAERLEMEIAKMVAPTVHVQMGHGRFHCKVHASPWRYHAAYLGAQMVASSHNFEQSCIPATKMNQFLQSLSTKFA